MGKRIDIQFSPKYQLSSPLPLILPLQRTDAAIQHLTITERRSLAESAFTFQMMKYKQPIIRAMVIQKTLSGRLRIGRLVQRRHLLD